MFILARYKEWFYKKKTTDNRLWRIRKKINYKWHAAGCSSIFRSLILADYIRKGLWRWEPLAGLGVGGLLASAVRLAPPAEHVLGAAACLNSCPGSSAFPNSSQLQGVGVERTSSQASVDAEALMDSQKCYLVWSADLSRVLLDLRVLMYLSIYGSVILSIYLFIYLSVCLSFYLSICLSFCLSICLSVCHSICLSICLSVCLSFYLSFYTSVCLSVCHSIYLSVCHSI